MRLAGRLLQLLALALLPIAMVVQLMGAFGPAQLLVALVFGFAAFYLGRMLEGYAVAAESEDTPKGKRRK